MGALRLFLSIVGALSNHPNRAASNSLDEIVSVYGDFSYIGSRKTLSDLVLREAGKLQTRLLGLSDSELRVTLVENSELAQCIEKIRRAESPDHVAVRWFARKKWQSNSGLYPDFVLALDSSSTFANGALLELKDSEGDTIASFNSTIPTRFKSLQDVQEINGSSLVSNAALVHDFPISTATTFMSDARYCMYAIRTKKKNPDQVRISIVEGSFFETLPKSKLLEEVWKQILDSADLSEAQRGILVSHLSQLKQSEIAKSRQVEKASVKPRFRIMSEVHEDANFHKYPEIAPRTINFIFKREAGYEDKWLQAELRREGFADARVLKTEESITLTVDGVPSRFRHFVILHKRNGEHLVLQFQLPQHS